MKFIKPFISIAIAIVVSFFNVGIVHAQPAPTMASLVEFAGTAPKNLGVKEGKLSPCPTNPNCVVSQGSGDEEHSIKPLTYTGDRDEVKETLAKVIEVVPRTKIVTATEDYIRAESSSKLLGFVDDLEFYLPQDEKVIHVRSAARLGESDLGVNRRRLEQIRLALKDLGV